MKRFTVFNNQIIQNGYGHHLGWDGCVESQVGGYSFIVYPSWRNEMMSTWNTLILMPVKLPIGVVVLKDSHSALPLTVDRVTMTSRSIVPVCMYTVRLALPARSLTV